MEQAVDLGALVANAPFAAVAIYFWRELQKLHKEKAEFMERQLLLFQKVALKVNDGQGD